MIQNKKPLNDEIKASRIKLISESWEIFWEMSLAEAKQKAKENALDLMQLWREWDLVIVKMLDFWKFQYKQKKQDQKNKQKWKTPDLKTIKITFKIWDHDLLFKKNQAQWFAKDWHPLKVLLTLRWRENQYDEIARNKIESFIKMLDEFYKPDKNLSKAGNNFFAMLSPK